MSDDTPPDNVLAFRVPSPHQTVGPSPLMQRRHSMLDRKPWCGHQAAYVDRDARDVTCQACGADLDPITVLDNIAREEMRLIWSREELVKLREERDELQREIRNLKAQAKRAMTKTR